MVSRLSTSLRSVNASAAFIWSATAGRYVQEPWHVLRLQRVKTLASCSLRASSWCLLLRHLVSRRSRSSSGQRQHSTGSSRCGRRSSCRAASSAPVRRRTGGGRSWAFRSNSSSAAEEAVQPRVSVQTGEEAGQARRRHGTCINMTYSISHLPQLPQQMLCPLRPYAIRAQAWMAALGMSKKVPSAVSSKAVSWVPQLQLAQKYHVTWKYHGSRKVHESGFCPGRGFTCVCLLPDGFPEGLQLQTANFTVCREAPAHPTQPRPPQRRRWRPPRRRRRCGRRRSTAA